MKVEYVKNAATGVVFVYSAELFKKPGMVPCDVHGKITPEVTQAAADQQAAAAKKGKTGKVAK